MGIGCSVKVSNLTNEHISVMDKIIPPLKHAYFDKEELLEDTHIYRWELEGKVSIEEIAADRMQSLDLAEELDGYKLNEYDNNGLLIGMKIYYDPAYEHLWYEMSVQYNNNGMPIYMEEKFYYYSGELMFQRKKVFTYDPNTGMPLGERPVNN